jgi:hypothetical protein
MKTASLKQNSAMTSTAVQPVTTITGTAARLSIAGASLFLVLLTLLHLLKPDLDPSWRMISEYEIGRFGWVMVLAFLSLACGKVCLFLTLRPHVQTRGGKVGLGFLLISALGITLGAVSTADPITASTEQLTMHGNLHGIGGLLGIPTFPIAAMLITLSLTRNGVWTTAHRSLLLTANLTWMVLATFILTVAVMLPKAGGFGPDVLIGWPNRLLMVAYCAWLMTAAWHTLKLTRKSS